MKRATRVLAAIATGGVVVGGATALWQVPAPKTATTAAVTTSTGSASGQAMQQLTDESAQLHAAVESAQSQLANLRADAVVPTASAADPGGLLAQAESQLAAARRRLAADEALLAKLQPEARATVPIQAQNGVPRQATPTAVVRQSETTPAATAPPPEQRTRSASPRPTKGAGDD
jgi:hypothetical protein